MKGLATLGFVSACVAAYPQEIPLPIIDMHLHAISSTANGPPGVKLCAPMDEMPTRDPAQPWIAAFLQFMQNPPCDDPLIGSLTNQEAMDKSVAILNRRNIYAVTSGPLPLLERWKAAAPDRIIKSLGFGGLMEESQSPETVRSRLEKGEYRVFGEVTIQYEGQSPSEDEFEPYLAIAEELDIPVGIHIGTGPPGAPYFPETPNYRARLHSPLILEDALVRHPKLRVYIMHAGWPMLDDLLAVLYVHPQVHVDVGVISFILPRKEFHRYLQRIVEAGFCDRVLFGSDQMNWPDAIEVAIEGIESAEFLSEGQKRDILYNNAARFLRLSQVEITRHHGK